MESVTTNSTRRSSATAFRRVNCTARGGALPADAAKRKRLKPDFESLPMLPARGLPPGTLLALVSGAERRRDVGVTIALNRELEVGGLALHPQRFQLRASVGASQTGSTKKPLPCTSPCASSDI